MGGQRWGLLGNDTRTGWLALGDDNIICAFNHCREDAAITYPAIGASRRQSSTTALDPAYGAEC